MNDRQISIRNARRLVSDRRLEAFLRAARAIDDELTALGLIVESLAEGQTLDECFGEGGEYGYLLAASELEDGSFRIAFGCQVDPMCGDGGEWEVTFSGDQVQSLTVVDQWMS